MELGIADFVWLLVFGSCALVLVCAVVSRTLHNHSESRALSRRVICRLCLHPFEDSSREKIVACPHCHAANEKGRSRRLG
jgi:hypothetical protein